MYRVPRAAFTASLLAQVRALGIPVRFGRRVVDYVEDESSAAAVVDLDDGTVTRVAADVVVAADGVGTKSHRLVSGRDIRAVTSGHSIFRAAYPAELVVADPELAARFSRDSGVYEMWSGDGLSVGISYQGENIEWTITHKVRYFLVVMITLQCGWTSSVGTFTDCEPGRISRGRPRSRGATSSQALKSLNISPNCPRFPSIY